MANEERSEGVPEGQKVPLDAPPDVFHAGLFTEGKDETTFKEKGYGPTEPPDLEEQPSELEEQPPKGGPSDESGKDVKEEPAKKSEESRFVPKDRFDEVNEKAKQYEESHRMLQWILQNPAEFAKMTGQSGQKPQSEGASESYESLLGKPPEPEKPLSEMSDQEVLGFLVAKEVHKILTPALKTLGKDLGDLKGFKEELSEYLVKTAVGQDGSPLYPRWDELKPVMLEIQKKYPGISKQEAYVLADKFSPPRVAPRQPVEPAPQRPAKKPASLAAARASFMSNLGGRSGASLKDNVRGMNIRECVEKALMDVGFTPSEEV